MAEEILRMKAKTEEERFTKLFVRRWNFIEPVLAEIFERPASGAVVAAQLRANLSKITGGNKPFVFSTVTSFAQLARPKMGALEMTGSSYSLSLPHTGCASQRSPSPKHSRITPRRCWGRDVRLLP
jgi:hypothetical protein